MKTLRVLCLHGARQDGEFFRHKVAKLHDALNNSQSTTGHNPLVEFTFVDGPWTMPLEEGDTVPMKCWYEPFVEPAPSFAISFHRDPSAAFKHLQKSLGTGPFDVFLGSSQGAQVIVDLLREPDVFRSTFAPALKAVVLYGCPLVRPLNCDTETPKIGIPSLHFAGETDSIVPLADSLTVATDFFADPAIRQHPHGHIVPTNVKDIETVRDFLEAFRDPIDNVEAEQQLAEEIEQVAMVFGGDGAEVVKHPPGSKFTTTVRLTLVEEPAVIKLAIQCPTSYPHVPPTPAFVGVPEMWRGRRIWEAQTCRGLCELSESLRGAPMMLPLFMAAKDAIDAKIDRVNAGDGTTSSFDASSDGGNGAAAAAAAVDPWCAELDTPEARETMVRAAERRAIELIAISGNGGNNNATEGATKKDPQQGAANWAAKKGGGDWRFTIGLVGKPSAGKSTFFNSITNPQSEADAAKVGAFPFTTIEPNYGTAFVGVPCPCGAYQLPDGRPHCNAIYGHMPQVGDEPVLRRVPVTIKDVAGLVKGAYVGKGKGNRFLNDLVDADVLVHVVDGAGATTREGDASDEFTKGDPADDVEWVRDEIHNWIFDNVRAKWSAIQHHPTKLTTMFSGYHARAELVEEALLRCGVASTTRDLNAKIPAWTPADLHLLIAVFIALRFPILIAFNKIDIAAATANLAVLRHRHPQYPVAPMSANTECALLHLRERGLVEYVAGDSKVALTSAAAAAASTDAQAARRLSAVTTFFSAIKQPQYVESGIKPTTGVTEALRRAVSLRLALVVFPVEDLATLEYSKGDASTVLQRCLMLKPGSTVEDVFDILHRDGAVGGKFVRCEGIMLATSCADGSATPATTPLPRPIILRRDDSITQSAILRIMANRLRPSGGGGGSGSGHGNSCA